MTKIDEILERLIATGVRELVRKADRSLSHPPLLDIHALCVATKLAPKRKKTRDMLMDVLSFAVKHVCPDIVPISPLSPSLAPPPPHPRPPALLLLQGQGAYASDFLRVVSFNEMASSADVEEHELMSETLALDWLAAASTTLRTDMETALTTTAPTRSDHHTSSLSDAASLGPRASTLLAILDGVASATAHDPTTHTVVRSMMTTTRAVRHAALAARDLSAVASTSHKPGTSASPIRGALSSPKRQRRGSTSPSPSPSPSQSRPTTFTTTTNNKNNNGAGPPRRSTRIRATSPEPATTAATSPRRSPRSTEEGVPETHGHETHGARTSAYFSPTPTASTSSLPAALVGPSFFSFLFRHGSGDHPPYPYPNLASAIRATLLESQDRSLVESVARLIYWAADGVTPAQVDRLIRAARDLTSDLAASPGTMLCVHHATHQENEKRGGEGGGGGEEEEEEARGELLELRLPATGSPVLGAHVVALALLDQARARPVVSGRPRVDDLIGAVVRILVEAPPQGLLATHLAAALVDLGQCDAAVHFLPAKPPPRGDIRRDMRQPWKNARVARVTVAALLGAGRLPDAVAYAAAYAATTRATTKGATSTIRTMSTFPNPESEMVATLFMDVVGWALAHGAMERLLELPFCKGEPAEDALLVALARLPKRAKALECGPKHAADPAFLPAAFYLMRGRMRDALRTGLGREEGTEGGRGRGRGDGEMGWDEEGSDEDLEDQARRAVIQAAQGTVVSQLSQLARTLPRGVVAAGIDGRGNDDGVDVGERWGARVLVPNTRRKSSVLFQ